MTNFCAECEQPILDRQLLLALERSWHEECLKCACCKCRLAELGDRFYTRAGLILCARDYVRLFGLSGHCALCCSEIAPGDWVMAIGGGGEGGQANPTQTQHHTTGGEGGAQQQQQQQQWKNSSSNKLFAHLDCFACSTCRGRFCIGEPFHFRDGLIFCQKHFLGPKNAK